MDDKRYAYNRVVCWYASGHVLSAQSQVCRMKRWEGAPVEPRDYGRLFRH